MEKMIRDYDDGDVPMIGSPLSEGKIVIKLKIPNSKPSEEGKRVCLLCKKEFSSGKALGGHMRIHVQSSNKNPNNIGTKPYYMNSVINEDGEPTCSQCGKTFPSMKSLCGHMRCHPERVWRGILPPPHTPRAAVKSPRRTVSLSESSSCRIDDGGGGGGDRAVDLVKFLRGWPVTERRGRKSAALKTEDDDGAVLLTAAEDLLSLANGNSNGGNGKRSVDMIKNFSNINEQEVVVAYKYKIKRRKKMKLMMELEQNADVTVVTGGVTPLAPSTEQQQQQRQQHGVNIECKYKCTSCDKCFATPQALGGHRSSHYKSKVKSCDYHRIEEDDYENSSQITSTGSGRKGFEFDLNEIPGSMMEEDEEATANGNGNEYASSSYNSNTG